MELVLPCINYRKSFEELVVSAKKYGDYKELGNSLIKDNETFDLMLKRLKDRCEGKNISSRDVPATVYWILVDGVVVGTIDLRHTLNKDYYERLGHVAYYIKPEDRNKGYATRALSIALKKYYEKGIIKILVTCFKDNIASSKVIEKNGGILEKIIIDEVTKKQISKYIIKIKNNNLNN